MTKRTSEQELFFLEAYVADNPGSAMFLKLARTYVEQDRLAEAAQVLRRGLAIQSANLEARGLLATVLERMGDTAGALEEAEAGTDELARHAGIFEQLASLYEQSGKSQKAAAFFSLFQRLSALGTGAPEEEPLDDQQGQIPADRNQLVPPAGDHHEVMKPSPQGGDGMQARLESLRQAALKRASR